MFTLAALAAAAGLIGGVFGLGPALRAARGQGTPGTFTAQDQICSRTCTWTGTFTSASGTVIKSVGYDDRLPAGTHPGSTIPALYRGGSNETFARHGSQSWLTALGLMVLSGGVLLAIVWLGPIRFLRNRRHQRVPRRIMQHR